MTELDVKQYRQGIFIDIYPLDACGDTESETDKVHRKVRKLNAKYIVYCNRKSLTNRINTIIRTPYYAWLHIRYGKHFGKKLEEMTKRIIYSRFIKDSKYVGVYWEGRGFRMIPREWIENRIPWPFEDREYWVPTAYDDLLKLQYGDYLKLPPENERVATHSYSVYEIEEL